MPGCAAPQPVPAEYDNPVFAGLKAVCAAARTPSGTPRLYCQAGGPADRHRARPPGYDAYLAAEAARRRGRPGAVRGRTMKRGRGCRASDGIFRAGACSAAVSGLGLPAL